MNFEKRIENLRNRRIDSSVVMKSFATDSVVKQITENYEKLQLPKSVKYAVGSMEEVDEYYTKNTLKEGEKVKEHLKILSDYGYSCSYRFQGSVTNNTHIKVYSDIDLLVVFEKFFFVQPPLEPAYPYTGNWRDELISLRQKCFEILNSVYAVATVDNSGKYSIALTGGSLSRDIDVVPSAWLETVRFRETNLEYFKGIQVYDKANAERSTNYPFLNNILIDEKDKICFGNFRKIIRLFKTLKADSDKKIDISSYDIIAMFYYMSNQKYNVTNMPLLLLSNAKNHLISLYQNDSYFSTLKVPDETRLISDKVKNDQLALLILEADELEKDILSDLKNISKSIEIPIDLKGVGY
jgi:hypothetical protein